jgi:hypothetical protein
VLALLSLLLSADVLVVEVSVLAVVIGSSASGSGAPVSWLISKWCRHFSATCVRSKFSVIQQQQIVEKAATFR